MTDTDIVIHPFQNAAEIALKCEQRELETLMQEAQVNRKGLFILANHNAVAIFEDRHLCSMVQADYSRLAPEDRVKIYAFGYYLAIEGIDLNGEKE